MSIDKAMKERGIRPKNIADSKVLSGFDKINNKREGGQMNKVTVEMIETSRGVDDGKIHPDTFVQGEQYEMGQDLAEVFIKLKVAKAVGKSDKKKKEVEENKAVDVKENKSKKG